MVPHLSAVASVLVPKHRENHENIQNPTQNFFMLIHFANLLFIHSGDGKADISIFRPLNGQWWYQRSLNNAVTALQFGTSTDKPVPADYDGDG